MDRAARRKAVHHDDIARLGIAIALPDRLRRLCYLVEILKIPILVDATSHEPGAARRWQVRRQGVVKLKGQRREAIEEYWRQFTWDSMLSRKMMNRTA